MWVHLAEILQTKYQRKTVNSERGSRVIVNNSNHDNHIPTFGLLYVKLALVFLKSMCILQAVMSPFLAYLHLYKVFKRDTCLLFW